MTLKKPNRTLLVNVLCAVLAWESAANAETVFKPVIPLTPVNTVFAFTQLTTASTTVASQIDGTATVNYTLHGTGSGSCTVRIVTGEAITDVPISPASGFPKTASVKFSKPGKFSVEAYGLGCAGSTGKQWMEVTAHPDYPCSLYPGFKKSAEVGVIVACVPIATSPSNNVQSKVFNCSPSTEFKNFGGYLFGCFPKGWSY